MVNREFWKGKRVFITGHTGFKGAWLYTWLGEMGAILFGYSDKEYPIDKALGVPSCSSYNICDFPILSSQLRAFKPDIVIHMAAQAIVHTASISPEETYLVNTMGTLCLLSAAKECSSVKTIFMVTTDKVYAPNPGNKVVDENFPLMGIEAYGSSKVCAEHIIRDYALNHLRGVAVLVGRAGNVIGGGDFAPYRVVPDIYKQIAQGGSVRIRHPKYTRPWQHVLDVLAGYMKAIEFFYGNPCYEVFNFGPPSSITVEGLVKMFTSNYSIEESSATFIENSILTLDSSKAKRMLNWVSMDICETVWLTKAWYERFMKQGDMRALTLYQIDAYEKGVYHG